MKKLLLIGGGHSHAIGLVAPSVSALSLMNNIDITIISDGETSAYSGILPAYIAGYYSPEDVFIPIKKIAERKGINFILDSLIDINADLKYVVCQSGKVINFDVLSIDIGSTPKKSHIEGADLYSIPAKPVTLLLEKWQKIVNYYQDNPSESITLNIIGGGAGGVELALNMNRKLTTILPNNQVTINLIHRGERLLENHNQWVSYKLTEILQVNQINLYLNSEVEKINQGEITLKSGDKIKGNYHILVTQASAPLWLKDNSINTDKEGFILIKNTLQTTNYDYIFASGDIATLKENSHPKAGVFAVRQGKHLFQNLVNFLENKPLKPYITPHNYLNIIGTGNKSAIASWGYLAWESPLLWYLKNRLDRRFMAKMK